MRPFALDKDMITMTGKFYPTGWVVMMLPGQDAARQAADALKNAGFAADDMMLLTPETIMGELSRTVGNSDIPLPSAGTEADTVRQMTHLAAQGQFGLMVHAPDAADSDKLTEALRGHQVGYAQKYRQLVIEDLEI